MVEGVDNTEIWEAKWGYGHGIQPEKEMQNVLFDAQKINNVMNDDNTVNPVPHILGLEG